MRNGNDGLWEDNGASRSVILCLTLSGTHSSPSWNIACHPTLDLLPHTIPNHARLSLSRVITSTKFYITFFPHKIICSLNHLEPNWAWGLWVCISLWIFVSLCLIGGWLCFVGWGLTQVFSELCFSLLAAGIHCMPSHTRWQRLCRPLTNHGMSWKTVEHLTGGNCFIYVSHSCWLFCRPCRPPPFYSLETYQTWYLSTWLNNYRN